jgi:hypothetical protein
MSQINPAIDYNSTTNYPGMVPGMTRKYVNSSGVEEQYIWCHSQTTSGTVAAGGTMMLLPAIGVGEVTDDVANSKKNYVYAVTQASTVAGSYFWGIVYKHGVTLITTGGNIAAGDAIVMGATHVGVRAVAGTASPYKTIGIAEADDGASSCVATVDLRGGY